ncbi:MAG: hypothetical protein DMG78_30585 [Acidobacteria bacterium]|nr:MAG: hypothetical protein DMG78_30585 [Acidobacteriota bacterium]
MIVPNHTTEDGGESDHAVDGLATAIAVSSNHAYGSRPLFGSCDCRALSARTIYRLGGLRGRGHPISSNPPLVAHRFPDLGSSHGANALALCPLTLFENWLEQKAGVEPYQGGFLLHYLDKLIYPDISATALTVAGVLVCAFNLAIYGRQAWPHNQRRT